MCRVFDSRQGYHFEHKNASACLGRDVFVFRYRYFLKDRSFLSVSNEKSPLTNSAGFSNPMVLDQ